MKKCRKCLEAKPTAAFYVGNIIKGKVYYKGICKICELVRCKMYKDSNKAIIKSKIRLRRESRLEEVRKKWRDYYWKYRPESKRLKSDIIKEAAIKKEEKLKSKVDLPRSSTFKRCNKCLHIKDYIYFYARKDGWCKECHKVKNRKVHMNNPSKTKARKIKRNKYTIKATPDWLTKAQLEEMVDIYKQAKELEQIFFNRKFHVDHIVPLQGKDVCGLHVPWNLQILTAEENLAKGNKYER